MNAFDHANHNVKYDDTLEALNRDSCKLMAEHYNNALKQKGIKGHFLFISAAPSIAPMLTKYVQMKIQAENFLLNNCPELKPIILRPGFVYHPSERGWSVPVRVANDVGYELNKKVIRNLPGNDLIQGFLP